MANIYKIILKLTFMYYTYINKSESGEPINQFQEWLLRRS